MLVYLKVSWYIFCPLPQVFFYDIIAIQVYTYYGEHVFFLLQKFYFRCSPKLNKIRRPLSLNNSISLKTIVQNEFFSKYCL